MFLGNRIRSDSTLRNPDEFLLDFIILYKIPIDFPSDPTIGLMNPGSRDNILRQSSTIINGSQLSRNPLAAKPNQAKFSIAPLILEA
jgi:hypothetical protein